MGFPKKLLLLAMVSASLGLAASPFFPKEKPSAGAPPSLGFSVESTAFLPLGDEASYYGLGYGAGLLVDYALPGLDWLHTRTNLAFGYRTLGDPNTSLSVFDGTLGVEAWLPLGEVFRAGAFVDGGYSYGILSGNRGSGGGGIAEGGLRLGLSFGPSFGIGLTASWRQYLGLAGGVAAGLNFTWRPDLAASSAGGLSMPLELELLDLKLDRLFPVFFAWYDSHPLGSVTVKNTSNRTVEAVELGFLIPQYMEMPRVCATIPSLKPGESAHVEIRAVLRNSVLDNTEATKVAAEVRLSWKAGGGARTSTKSGTLQVLDRNAMSWDDDRRAAAFVTAKDPLVLGFSKNTLSAIKGRGNEAVDRKLAIGMALFDALIERGMTYATDPTTPYSARGSAGTSVDYLQFPRQSLGYKAGDCDDLSILYCALLESVGVESAFITVPGHIYAAFALDATVAKAQSLYSRPDTLVLRDGKAWLPVEITSLKKGFLDAWESGAREWREANAKGQAGFWPIREAWNDYPPAGLGGSEAMVAVPAMLGKRFDAEMAAFVAAETTPRIALLKAAVAKTQSAPEAVNKLGVYYAQWGMYELAEREFAKLASGAKPYPAAVMNLANLRLVRQDFKAALERFLAAQALLPADGRPLLGAARARFGLKDYAAAKKDYDRLARLDPTLAQKYAYLAAGAGDGSRAADASQTLDILEWVEQ